VDITSVEGLLVVVLFVFPGALGDILMREFLRMLQPRSEFRQLTSAVGWSLSALLVVEAWEAIGQGSFGGFLISPVLRLGPTARGLSEVASHWLAFAVLAALLPLLLRKFLLTPAMQALTKHGQVFRTVQVSTIDRALDMAHVRTPKGSLPARVTTDSGTITGSVVWSTQGREEDAALILQKSNADKSLTWVPVRSVVFLELFDDPKRLDADSRRD